MYIVRFWRYSCYPCHVYKTLHFVLQRNINIHSFQSYTHVYAYTLTHIHLIPGNIAYLIYEIRFYHHISLAAKNFQFISWLFKWNMLVTFHLCCFRLKLSIFILRKMDDFISLHIFCYSNELNEWENNNNVWTRFRPKRNIANFSLQYASFVLAQK